MEKPMYQMTLAELREVEVKARGYIALGVSEPRQGGSTWQQIGDELGVSAQEAHRRYRYHQPRELDTPDQAPRP